VAARPRYSRRLIPALALVLALAVATTVAGCTLGGGSSGRESRSAPRGGTIRGAGSTLAAPLYRRLARSFRRRAGTDVRYEASGSGRGVSQFTAALVDFGATDGPLNDVEVATAADEKSQPVHVPVAFGAVAVVYRLPGTGGTLRLDGPALAAIFLGRVTRWDDRTIARLNPRRRLPPTPIAVVHRGDSSGSTRLFTSYLAGASPEFSRRLGTDEAVAWPVGASVSTNVAMARAVARRVGAIGYVGAADARFPGVSRAAVPNRTGRFVAPTSAAIGAATRGLADVPDDLRFVAVGASPDPGAYPIASATFVLVYRDLCRATIDAVNARRVRQWLGFVLGRAGQRVVAASPGFAALPPEVAAKARAAAGRLACDGKRL
jgi:phosphate transport system substrate-binding protein